MGTWRLEQNISQMRKFDRLFESAYEAWHKNMLFKNCASFLNQRRLFFFFFSLSCAESSHEWQILYPGIFLFLSLELSVRIGINNSFAVFWQK